MDKILQIYHILFEQYGRQYWWPGETVDEIIIGAILTQNTNWNNVEKSIQNLKKQNLLSLKYLKNLKTSKLETLIKPAGFYKVKAKYLKNAAKLIDIEKIEKLDIKTSRQTLLNIKGIGPETADSILLYAFNKPIFVIDAYTKRIFSRLGIVKHNVSYQKLQKLFMVNLTENSYLFQEYHALLVYHAKHFCRSQPLCSKCAIVNHCNKKFENR